MSPCPKDNAGEHYVLYVLCPVTVYWEELSTKDWISVDGRCVDLLVVGMEVQQWNSTRSGVNLYVLLHVIPRCISEFVKCCN